MGYEELACNGYLRLAERLRSKVETAVVQRVLEGQMRVQVRNACTAYEGGLWWCRVGTRAGGSPSIGLTSM